MGDNLDSLLDLEKNLIEMGLSLQRFPWVIQYNKRDLPDIETIERLESKLNFFGAEYFEAVASDGTAVLRTLKSVMKRVIDKAEILVN